MNTNSLTVSDWPVARNSDPLTSVEAGEDREAREESEVAVLHILETYGPHPMTSYDVAHLARSYGFMWTDQRLRTALAQLGRKGLIERAGRREGASPTGRAAMTWKLATR